MKVVHLNTSDVGGAGIVAKKLHLGLLERGIDSSFVTKHHFGEEFKGHYLLKQKEPRWLIQRLGKRIKDSILSRLGISETPESYFLKGRSPQYEHFSFPWSDLDPGTLDVIKHADIIHLHWISDGFIDYRKIFSYNKKFVWTMHDMNPFTGGCHHSDGCTKYEINCNYCYQLAGTRNEYLSYYILRYKLEALAPATDLKIVSPSKWLADLSERSALLNRFEHHVIPNMNSIGPISVNREELRKKHKIDESATVFIFVAHHFDNPRKGIRTLMSALEKLQEKNIRVIAIGEKHDHKLTHTKLRQFGYVNDKLLLKELYTLSDAFILPSVAENFPNTIVESLLCGTPVIASNVGGIPELVTKENGLLVNLEDVDDWVAKLSFFIKNKQNYNREAIKQKAQDDYDNTTILDQYIEIYKTLMK